MSYLKMSYSCLMRDVFKDTLKEEAKYCIKYFFFLICKSMYILRKPIRVTHFSDKYDLRFQDRSFDVELLLEVESLLKVE